MMYKCNVCNKIFDEPISESAESFYGVSEAFSYSCGEMIYMCPYCKETWFEEFVEEEEEEDERD